MPKYGPKTVYIAGALTDIKPDQREKLHRFYDDLGEVCANFGLQPYLPHHHGDPEILAHLTPQRIDRIDRLAVTQAYLVIAYVGVASTGVGIEIEIAHHSNKPVVLLAEQAKLTDKRITRLARGNPSVIAEIGFKDFEHAKIELHKFLQSFADSMTSEELPLPLRLEA
jgi:nucleoside 2-deoxyribosyltransferase